MKTSTSLYRGHRFPADVISHCVWLYFRFPLSYRDVEDMMAERGVEVSYAPPRVVVTDKLASYIAPCAQYIAGITPEIR